jgi:hypothetical protein
MTNTHIHAVLDTQLKISNEIRSVFQRELEYRKNNNLVIHEDNTLHKIDHRLKYLAKLGINISVEYGKKISFTLKGKSVFIMVCSDKHDFNHVLAHATKIMINTIYSNVDIKINKKTGKITKIEDYGKQKYKK